MADQEQAIVSVQVGALDVPEEGQVRAKLAAIGRFQAIVRASLKQDHDYGVIPGTGTKPTLLKPGAEKIAKLLGLADEYTILDKIEDWQTGFFRYIIQCRLRHIETGSVVSEGLGECNSRESKYRWRWVFGSDVPPSVNKETLVRQSKRSRRTGKDFIMYRMENDDIYSQVNTILKMAKKRALVDAALSAGRLSDMFTQDIEDFGQATPPADAETGEIQESPPAKQEDARKPPPAATVPNPTAQAKPAPKRAVVADDDQGGIYPDEPPPPVPAPPRFASLDEVRKAASAQGLGTEECLAVWKVAYAGTGMTMARLNPDDAWQKLVEAGKVTEWKAAYAGTGLTMQRLNPDDAWQKLVEAGKVTEEAK